MRMLVQILLWCAVAFSGAPVGEEIKETAAEARWRRFVEGPHVKRGVLPQLKLQNLVSATAEEAAQIKQHIANLAMIERPDFGLSGTMSGMAFAPISDSRMHAGGFLLTNHQLETTDDFKALVEFGPRALPYLLESLGDKTPTKLRQTHSGGFGGMFLGAEMGANPTNSIEQRAMVSLPKRGIDFSDERSISAYTVTVGDVSFVAIGQIVGRDYLAVRYQPTAIIVINSPVEEKSVAKAVRDIWSSTNAAQRLFDSLLFDYSTEGVFNGESLDGWSIASDLQCQAAMRMLYYFPQETAPLIADRLAKLDVSKREGDVANFISREVSNGVRTDDFIRAVAWSENPEIQRELVKIFERTTDPDIAQMRVKR